MKLAQFLQVIDISDYALAFHTTYFTLTGILD